MEPFASRWDPKNNRVGTRSLPGLRGSSDFSRETADDERVRAQKYSRERSRQLRIAFEGNAAVPSGGWEGTRKSQSTFSRLLTGMAGGLHREPAGQAI